ncbi:Phosphatidylserine/phosphatidylglycerophosphate/cardiolipin synthase [Nitrosovibrio sp. Nv4]|uniref:VTT domain-containing protein n=2 Tax=Nitrosovibrio sp. Nv4 TaxID=1945880 RepID=UPI000BC7DAC4|nr:VTT domain-containing protein [Nitrosovibrio sp. Nv4]SOD41788.1 Phosphatidylserine/phosphatidylglycerophosphate/cardiolipin synthase [Nitrosovibrio sp. Nv4]
MTRPAILKPGDNCWRMERADRAAFIVDGADFFKAFRETVKQAQRSVLIIAWDIDSRVKLVREGESDGLPVELGDFLTSMVKRNSKLDIHILDWDFVMIFAPDREWLPLYKEKWNGHPRLHFCLDDRHPTGACHHQKIVVVDDQIAFAGGLDLTLGRWDTPQHTPCDPRRRDLESEQVPQPYHDIQMMVSGPAAAALGELARERWRHATGATLPAPRIQAEANYWPAYLAPDVENVDVAICRTVPKYENQAEVREVERLLVDAIAAARQSIYIEAQYFTAHKITAALAKRLKEEDGPEVAVLLPEHTVGWLSKTTMDVLRERSFRQLLKADHYNRLRLYEPCIPGLDDECVNIHSKVTIIDDELLRIGSANLNNRSMGLDTECDLVIEANGKPHIRSAIHAFRNRLLEEHLGMEASRIEERLAQEGSLIRTIESLRGSGRTVRPLTFRVTPEMDAWVPDDDFVDPGQPMDPSELMKEFVPEEERGPVRNHIFLILTILAAILGLAAMWQWSPLREWVNVDNLVGFAAEFEQAPSAPLLTLGVFLISGIIAFPLTVLIVVCVLVFGPWQGFLYSMLGALLSAVSTYGLGHLLGRNTVRRFAGKKLHELNKRLARRGLMTIIVVRIIPFAPFSVINMIAGASKIRFRDFVIGSAIGMLPGIVGISLFTDRLAATIQEPDLPAFAILVAVVGVIIVAGWTFWRWEERHRNPRLRAQSD